MRSATRIKAAAGVKMRLEEEICSLISEVQDFNLSSVERIELPTALEFHRYVAANRPVIITLPPRSTTTTPTTSTSTNLSSLSKYQPPDDSFWAWPAFTQWTNEYLAATLGSRKITVACTPTGWADAVVDDNYFAMPCEKKMTFEEFLDGMPIRTRRPADQDNANANGNGNSSDSNDNQKENKKLDPYQEVRYIQLQNGNLMTEYQELLGDVPASIPFASEALGKEPDAVNFWYGDERSTTSLHKGK
ncbi:JmjC domain-containing protein 7 [Podila epigama]|nr:JmjC domain-containing protein 7 [Podila epigama]